jgi:short subunit dehydrogenase-like uncharacterized protein
MKQDEDKMDPRLIPIEIECALRSGNFKKVTTQQLNGWIAFLNTNPGQHREIIQALTLQNIQMQKHLSKLNRFNTILTVVLIFLAIISVLSGIASYKVSLELKSIETKLSKQVQPQSEEAKSTPTQNQREKKEFQQKPISKNSEDDTTQTK